MRFPVYLLARDCGRVAKYESIYDLQKHLEAIDIENEEYRAWDAEGQALELGTQKPIWIRIEEKGKDLESLIRALTAFAAYKGVEVKSEPSSAVEIEALLETITGKGR
jgi:hypothetical protein